MFREPQMTQRPQNRYDNYHAHVYFDAQTVGQARVLCGQAGELFGVAVGRIHEKLVGPHPQWSCQLAFDSKQFDQVVPWLEQNRGGMDVFVHGLTGDDLADHTTHAMWLGNEHALNLAIFGGTR
jgi:aromatic ring-cleaving dioxygenase